MYGGLRPGANLYGESVVAVDIRTGEHRWHFQTSHHPLWDYDIPTAPILVDAVKDGRTIKALAQATKQGLLFVLNRETGEPDLADSRGRRAARQRARRMVFADAADSDASLRSPRRRDRRPHRLHSGAARRGRAHRRRAPDRTDLHAGRRVQPERAAQHADGHGRQQLARRLVRSRHEDDLRDGERRREQHDDLPLRGRLRDAARHLPRPRRRRVRRPAQRQRAGPAAA